METHFAFKLVRFFPVEVWRCVTDGAISWANGYIPWYHDHHLWAQFWEGFEERDPMICPKAGACRT